MEGDHLRPCLHELGIPLIVFDKWIVNVVVDVETVRLLTLVYQRPGPARPRVYNQINWLPCRAKLELCLKEHVQLKLMDQLRRAVLSLPVAGLSQGLVF